VHQLMVTAGPAADMMTISSRRRLLAYLAANDAAAAAAEMERHLRVLCFMGRLAGRA
jgi:DNA-binding GntR family transcriptional regulator